MDVFFIPPLDNDTSLFLEIKLDEEIPEGEYEIRIHDGRLERLRAKVKVLQPTKVIRINKADEIIEFPSILSEEWNLTLFLKGRGLEKSH
ncbi:hypothetical protein DJ528_06190, partial [Sulfolobus sp. B5]